MIKKSVISLVGKDNTVFPIAQVSYLGKTSDVELISPYGLCSNPPEGSLVIMFNLQGQEESKAGIANLVEKRFANLKPGEVVVGNYLTGSFVKFSENGDITVDAGSNVCNIIAKTLNINVDNLNVTGDTAFTGAVTANGKVIDNTHGHSQANDSAGDTQVNINGVL